MRDKDLNVSAQDKAPIRHFVGSVLFHAVLWGSFFVVLFWLLGR